MLSLDAKKFSDFRKSENNVEFKKKKKEQQKSKWSYNKQKLQRKYESQKKMFFSDSHFQKCFLTNVFFSDFRSDH